MTEKGYNQRRACALAGIDPRVHRRVSKRPTDSDLRDRLKELPSERRRFGYQRLHILLKREGWQVYRARFALVDQKRHIVKKSQHWLLTGRRMLRQVAGFQTFAPTRLP